MIPKMRAELAEEEEVVAPLITKEVPTTLKSGMLVVDVCTFSVKDVKSSAGSEATVELKTIEPNLHPVTINRLLLLISSTKRRAEMI